MRHEIVLAPEAVEDLRSLRAHVRTEVRDMLERHLRHDPHRLTAGGRIKRLRGLSRPQYRLRVGDLRVFYDVGEGRVHVLAIVAKADAALWLERSGEP
ncbi:MAG: type II toxin-antitoxin system RelE/ParE family toxin [Planctomycetota bacterium]